MTYVRDLIHRLGRMLGIGSRPAEEGSATEAAPHAASGDGPAADSGT
jgi:hypothetical protein